MVDELDLSGINFCYKGGGNSSYHPRMLLKVLFYAYLNNVYSCRKIETQLEQNIHYIWLSGDQQPNFRTINNFRSLRLKGSIHKLFIQVVYMLVDMGYITLREIYIDGTKIESKANGYSFVWRKSVEKNKAKLESKIRGILSQIEEGIAQDNNRVDAYVNKEQKRSFRNNAFLQENLYYNKEKDYFVCPMNGSAHGALLQHHPQKCKWLRIQHIGLQSHKLRRLSIALLMSNLSKSHIEGI